MIGVPTDRFYEEKPTRFAKRRILMVFDELNDGNCLLYNRVAGHLTDAKFELHIYNGNLDVLDRLFDPIIVSHVCIVVIAPPDALSGRYLSQKLKKPNEEQVTLMRTPRPGPSGIIRCAHLNHQRGSRGWSFYVESKIG